VISVTSSIEKTGPLFEKGGIRAALKSAAEDVTADFLAKAKADIEGAQGHFGSRWRDGFSSNVVENDDGILIQILHRVPYFNVFVKTTTIHGKPMLWIPLSFAKDAQGVYARNYKFPLFRVNRKDGKAPLLFAFSPKGGKWPWIQPAPKYFGKESVTIPQKFHTRELARETFPRVGSYLAARLA
jgi:hypothetical protein